MGTPDTETLGEWFDELVGVDRKSASVKKMSAEERRQLLSKGHMKRRLQEGLKAYNSRRKEKHLGTYSFKKHIVYNRFNNVYKDFKSDILKAEGYEFKSEVWGFFGKVRTVRDERGRIITWHKSKRK